MEFTTAGPRYIYLPATVANYNQVDDYTVECVQKIMSFLYSLWFIFVEFPVRSMFGIVDGYYEFLVSPDSTCCGAFTKRICTDVDKFFVHVVLMSLFSLFILIILCGVIPTWHEFKQHERMRAAVAPPSYYDQVRLNKNRK